MTRATKEVELPDPELTEDPNPEPEDDGREPITITLERRHVVWLHRQMAATRAMMKGGGKRTVTSSAGKGNTITLHERKREFTLADEVERIIRKAYAEDPHRSTDELRGTGPRGEFNPKTGTWDQ